MDVIRSRVTPASFSSHRMIYGQSEAGALGRWDPGV